MGPWNSGITHISTSLSIGIRIHIRIHIICNIDICIRINTSANLIIDIHIRIGIAKGAHFTCNPSTSPISFWETVLSLGFLV